LIRWLCSDFTKTSVNQPVRSISASARASARSVFTGRALSASAARRASITTTGSSSATSPRASHGVVDPVSSPTRTIRSRQRWSAAAIISG